VKPLQDAVHFAFRVVRADVELERQALQHHESFGSPSGDLREAAAAEVLPQHRFLLPVRRAQR